MPSTKVDFTPRIIDVELPDAALIEAVGTELTDRAKGDQDSCFGYFPSLASMADIESDLPMSKRMRTTLPSIEVAGLRLDFNFVRRSLIRQSGDSPFHLDTDANTALTGDVDTLQERLVWRLLLNLSDQHTRRLSYLDKDPLELPLQTKGGYLHCPADAVDPGTIRHIDLKPRDGKLAQAVLFCSSRVLHTGTDSEAGHFVAGYGAEEPA